MTPKLAVFLKDYRASREVLYLELDRILSLDDLVFTSVSGEPINPSVITHNFHKMTARAGLTGCRFR